MSHLHRAQISNSRNRPTLLFFVLVCDSGDFSASFALTASAGRERMLAQASRYVPSLEGSRKPSRPPPPTTTPAFMLRWNLDGAVKSAHAGGRGMFSPPQGNATFRTLFCFLVITWGTGRLQGVVTLSVIRPPPPRKAW